MAQSRQIAEHKVATSGGLRLPSIFLALIIVAICAFSAFKGAQILMFALVTERANVSFAALRDPRVRAGIDAASLQNELAQWTDVSGLRSGSRSEVVSLDLALGLGPATDRLAPDVSALLAVNPMSGRHWILLSNAVVLAGDNFATALSAFDMSSLVAPREFSAALARVYIGVREWERMPDQQRDRIAYDLASIGPLLRPHERNQLWALVRTRSDPVKDEIRARLQQRGAINLAFVKELGL